MPIGKPVGEEKRPCKWIDLQFTDLIGKFDHVTLSVPSYAKPDEIMGKVDGSSIKGFALIEESDLFLKPDPSTWAKLPWFDDLERYICNVFDENTRLERDPRYVLEKTVSGMADASYRVLMGVELEFIVFKTIRLRGGDSGFGLGYFIQGIDEGRFTLPQKHGYGSQLPVDNLMEFRQNLCNILSSYFGIKVISHHHEVASNGQIELSLKEDSPVNLADKIQTTKYAAKVEAHKNNLTASFLPKPLYGDNGSGMHVHVSLWRKNRNVFDDPDDEYAHLSQEARYFIGGLLEHSRAISAIIAPTTNSYRRLVPGYEAPVYLVWGKANRSAAIRVPISGSSSSRRIEYRSPDPSSNPYLALAAILMAGLDGIKKKIDSGDPLNVNACTYPKRHQLKTLPRTLWEALDELESDNNFLKPVFSDDLLETYINLKRREAEKVYSHPHPAEFREYIDLL